MAKANVKITKDGMEAKVTPRSAKTFARHGWTVVDDGSSETPAPGATPPEPTTSREAE